jgi:glycosyltransferase involved in cell wall biosynthesis
MISGMELMQRWQARQTPPRRLRNITVVIPALNEEDAIGDVVTAIPRDMVRDILVVDNGSTDRTGLVAKQAGAMVISEPRRGFGRACLAGIRCLELIQPDVVVFLDGSMSFYPEDIPRLIAPIIKGQYDMVIGSRLKGEIEKGSLTRPQIYGTLLATRLVDYLFKVNFTDFGNFRAIRYDRLIGLGLRDAEAGFGMEMQLKAAKQKLRITEVPVRYQKRLGTPKVTGTLFGSVNSSLNVISVIANHIFMN